MTTRNEPVEGQMILKNYYYESGSSHLEKSHRISLVPYGAEEVRLTEQTDSSNAYRPHEDKESVESWIISVEALTDLIKSHGKKL
ncbi:hypothetical protein [Chitinimonas koreensis]|uniref:hypothetical protein n=1 Tax=Chitinimonas koreensis TaxID=356302 RepID=UPI0012F91572|nr:hypothetical protein [Chitinimonas koreensis]QNM95489.1 hypothetical protein H9L41_16680 [Chitinimonas koreensis]